MLQGDRSGLRGSAPASSQPSSPALPQILISDFEDVEAVNKQLEAMGYNIGVRLVDEFLAKSRLRKCGSFHETADVIAKQAFPMFLNMQTSATRWSEDGKECSLVFAENPLTEFVDLPEDLSKLKYLNVLCGVIRGALEMVNMDVDVHVEKDMLRGDEYHELRMRLKEYKDERFPYTEDD